MTERVDEGKSPEEKLASSWGHGGKRETLYACRSKKPE